MHEAARDQTVPTFGGNSLPVRIYRAWFETKTSLYDITAQEACAPLRVGWQPPAQEVDRPDQEIFAATAPLRVIPGGGNIPPESTLTDRGSQPGTGCCQRLAPADAASMKDLLYRMGKMGNRMGAARLLAGLGRGGHIFLDHLENLYAMLLREARSIWLLPPRLVLPLRRERRRHQLPFPAACIVGAFLTATAPIPAAAAAVGAKKSTLVPIELLLPRRREVSEQRRLPRRSPTIKKVTATIGVKKVIDAKVQKGDKRTKSKVLKGPFRTALRKIRTTPYDITKCSLKKEAAMEKIEENNTLVVLIKIDIVIFGA
ncbi:ribosomal protein L23a [Culex quinquefasciatus]|uniref:Ribosomal protein L23a n=1 Tax=Culex quinquefasciatus TaxID=7176 RepID=B0W0N2_CULQU|nr:ribosomal protein L23a [Culex quinquefasciatus]|eukprot:XP_001842266.1 ribosomal protein L23a [Culex quinquefasciatus]